MQTEFSDDFFALRVNSLHARKYSFLSSADIFQNQFFHKILSGIISGDLN